MIKYCIAVICILSILVESKEITGAFGIRFGETISDIRYKKISSSNEKYQARHIAIKYRKFNTIYVYATEKKITKITALFEATSIQEAKDEYKIITTNLKEKYGKEAEQIADGFASLTIKLSNATIIAERTYKTVYIAYFHTARPKIKDNSKQIDNEIKRTDKSAL